MSGTVYPFFYPFIPLTLYETALLFPSALLSCIYQIPVNPFTAQS